MKNKIASCVVVLAASAMVLLAAVPAGAVGVSAGASTWYAWWGYTPHQGNGDFDPGLLYGPVVGIDFAKHWSVTSVFLTGNLGERFDGLPDLRYRRYDSDTTVGYSFARYFKIFAGFKYVRFDDDSSGGSTPIFGSANQNFYTMGPGAGLSCLVPLTDTLFGILNFSGLYCYGKYKDPSVSDNTKDLGYNITAAIAWHYAPASVTLTLGGRYQYLDSRYDTMTYDSKTKFYGITFSAVYHFRMGDSE
ncbi:MAG: hypothetical protein EPN93_00835 [Spirochaetes bacterium]|nr:MAG: hypothetical protein EPN93_00835 [Spirochaetota bacterium]